MISSGTRHARDCDACKQTANTTPDALENISRNVEGGMTLTDAFSQYPNIFNKLYISMISAGEVGGQRGNPLRLSNQLLEKAQDEIKSATSYPKVIILAVCVCGNAGIPVPTFEQYAGEDAPLISRFIFGCL